MPWVRMTEAWDWKPKPQVTIAYKAGATELVTTACAKAAVAAGKAERVKKGSGDAQDKNL